MSGRSAVRARTRLELHKFHKQLGELSGILRDALDKLRPETTDDLVKREADEIVTRGNAEVAEFRFSEKPRNRAICFDGTWPDPVQMLAFKPWNKRA